MDKSDFYDQAPKRFRNSPYSAIALVRFFAKLVFIIFTSEIEFLFYFYMIGLLRATDWCDQKRSERIRVLPYSSIALTRSCFTEFFFIAIPP